MRSRMNARMRSARCWSCLVTLGPYRTDVHLSIPSQREDKRPATAGAPEGAGAPLFVGILPSVTIDTSVVFDYATRTFWALIVVIVTLLLARVVRRTTMRALTRGRAQ